MRGRVSQAMAMAAAVCAAALWGAGMAAAQDAPAGPTGEIRAVGEGSVLSVPDMALVRLGVEARADDPGAAMQAMSEATRPVMDALKKAGIAERDMRTGQLSLRPDYADGPMDGRDEGPRIVGHVASTTIEVRVRDLSALGGLLDQAVSVGATRFDGLDFMLSDPSGARDAALAGAVADAVRKARLMADAAGVGLGRTLEIVEEGGGGMPRETMAMDAMRAAEGVPIAAGETETTARVGVTFGIVQP
ncbi:hypothetical protein OCGS_0098 [Oceaniovalibus guishaninsula JLT2003]|uniref:Uncharacterized protein n=1 Tax=Oceaniovalibus guishaninsula JLT2003 TaxID=1231392 RepID=K2HHG8_9RHOB|nr:SIMPL domain-containing protein [Oceaniovalibus guishaninsula]EKE45872.1 hypothetical protein OCGS_0098 [Oceaniovalibus guishaninsula JLT2003]